MADARITQSNYRDGWPSFLKKLSLPTSTTENSWQPVVIEMNQRDSTQLLKDLVRDHSITSVNDNYDEQLAELVISQNPQLYRANIEVKRSSVTDYLKKHYGQKVSWQVGSWVYYPWQQHLIHVLDKDLFFEMRTIRNKDLITAEEQVKYRKFRVGCGGMSIGSNGALALALTGGSEQLKLADGAVISGSNLNRILTGVDDIGREKSLVVARKIYEMNPYVEIERISAKLTEKNLQSFFDQPWPLDVVVDEVDDLETKIRLRVEARKRKLPVIMVTELGDDMLLDVERFDLNQKLPLFHGIAGNIEDVLGKELSQRDWLKYATTIINTKNVPLRMQQSLLKVGTKIVTHPQLGSSAMISGAIISFAVRQLSLKQPLKSGRQLMSLDHHFVKGAKSFAAKRAHSQHTKRVKKALSSM